MKILLILLLIFVFVISGCDVQLSDENLESISGNVIVCDSPYIRYGSGCCLDQNNNKICDKDESKRYEKPKCIVAPGISCENYGLSDHEIGLQLRSAVGYEFKNVEITIFDSVSKSEKCKLSCKDCSEENTIRSSQLTSWMATNCEYFGSTGTTFKGDILFSYEDGLPHAKTGSIVAEIV